MCWQRTKQAKKKKIHWAAKGASAFTAPRKKPLLVHVSKRVNEWESQSQRVTSPVLDIRRIAVSRSLHFNSSKLLPLLLIFFYQPDFISVWDVLNLWRVSDTRSRALWFSFRFDVLLILVIHFISVIAKIKWIEEEEEEERRMKNIKKNHIRQINKDNRLIETRRTQNDDDVKPKTGEAKTKCITCTHTRGHGWEQSLNCEIRQKLTMNKKKNALNVDVET